ncbi:unnamed protein product [Amoebophrya sp. A120]|nr:unnamed protein product [Amoebophrya sp. A120]|eukprot:GSA120T00017249001.1
MKKLSSRSKMGSTSKTAQAEGSRATTMKKAKVVLKKNRTPLCRTAASGYVKPFTKFQELQTEKSPKTREAFFRLVEDFLQKYQNPKVQNQYAMRQCSVLNLFRKRQDLFPFEPKTAHDKVLDWLVKNYAAFAKRVILENSCVQK